MDQPSPLPQGEPFCSLSFLSIKLSCISEWKSSSRIIYFIVYSKPEMSNWCIVVFLILCCKVDSVLNISRKHFGPEKQTAFPGITVFSFEKQTYFTLEGFLRGHRMYRNPVFFCRSFFCAVKVKAVFQSASSTFSCLSSQFLIAGLIS